MSESKPKVEESINPNRDTKINDNMDYDQYLSFFLNGQEYAVDILKVQGIQGWLGCTSLPNTPEHILGVINLRGAIVPVVDLRLRFNLPTANYDKMTVVIIVKIQYGTEEKTVGLLVDAVSEVHNVNSNEVNIAPSFGSEVDLQYVRGLVNVEDHMLILLNLEKMINESILNIVDGMLAA